MPIDLSQVQWDASPQRATAGGIDPNSVQWDDAPITDLPAVSAAIDPADDPRGFIPPADVPADGQSLLNIVKSYYPDWDDRKAARELSAYYEKQGVSKPEFYSKSGLDKSLLGFDSMPKNDPTEGMSFGQRFAAGGGKFITDTGRGLKQLGTELVRGTFGSRPGLTVPENAISRWADRSLEGQEANIAESRRVDAPLMQTGAGMGGAATGALASMLIPGAALRGTGLGRAFLPSTVGGNVAQGAALGAIQPTAEGGERLRNIAIGGGASLLGAGIPKLVGGTVGAVRNSALTEAGAARNAVRTIQGEATNPEALMRPNPSAIPGAKRSLYEETLDPGVARMETRQRGAGGGWVERDSVNNQRSVEALRTISGDQAAMDAAVSARDQATTGLRNRAFSEGAQGDAAALQAQQALRLQLRKDAADTAAENARLRSLGMSGQKPVPTPDDIEAAVIGVGKPAGSDMAGLENSLTGISAANRGRAAVESAVNEVTGALKRADDSVSGLYNVRKGINDLLDGKAGADKSWAKAASKELIQMRELIDAEIATRAPSFGDYLGAFRAGSKPIDRMKIGQEIIKKGSGNKIDPGTSQPRLTADKIGAVEKNLDAVAQKATGFGKAKASDVLTPADFAKLRAVSDDLNRAADRLSRGTGGGGSHTASQGQLNSRVTKALLGKIPGYSLAAEFLDAQAAKRLSGSLDLVLQHPEKYRAIATKLSAEDRRLLERATVIALGRSGGVAAALTE